MKLLFDESLSPSLVQLLGDLFPGSKSALRNGLARAGDRRILEYASTHDLHDFILVSTRFRRPVEADSRCLGRDEAGRNL